MCSPTDAPVAPIRLRQRVIGVVDQGTPGPLFVIVGSIHGNEPAGVAALERVLARLADGAIAVRGRLVAVAGNLGGLARGQRYVDRDLNRMWTPDNIARIRTSGPQPDCAEEAELAELLGVFDSHQADASMTVFLDLHSTSASSSPFCLIGDTLRNRRVAFALHMPVILGLEESIDGALLDHMHERGFVTVGIEGGQHDSPRTVDCLEAAVLLAMAASGAIANHEPVLGPCRERLVEASQGKPPVVEILYRHAITDADEFVMAPGYQSFQRVDRGQHLGRDRRGEVASELDGCILMPLYQGKGEDGFFLGRPVRPLWLWLSARLRHFAAARLLSLLPGVRRHPVVADALLVDRRVARWQVNNVFHLFGYRKARPEGDQRVFSRRREA